VQEAGSRRSNYGGKPETLSTQAKLPITVVSQFQPIYFRAFPAHRMWHEWIEDQLRASGQLTTLTGRRRQFWGRRSDPKTFREAAAYDPQGSLADIVNTAMLQVWRARDAVVMMQDHDAITIQYPEELEDEIVPKVIEQLKVEVPLEHGRSLIIPYDAKVGWNRADFDYKNPDKNPNGLKDYKPGDKRKRQATPSLLDRPFR
jgi:DNA polymerase I-like protein with 3'-5' exonuclease and polymerase domains